MEERRKHNRPDLGFYSRVYERASGRPLGNLLNITPQGAMVLCEKPQELNVLMELHIELPEGIADKSELVISSQSMWCRPDINPEFYDAGFMFTGVSQEDTDIIQLLVQNYSFRRE